MTGSPSPDRSPAFPSPGSLFNLPIAVGNRLGWGQPRAIQLGSEVTAEESTVQATRSGREFFRSGSVTSSLVNLSAAALGAGALALPKAMYYSGILYGPILMVCLAVLS